MASNFEGEQGAAYCESKGYHFAAARIAEQLGTYDMQKTAVKKLHESKQACVCCACSDKNGR